jgi:hypothetical protein
VFTLPARRQALTRALLAAATTTLVMTVPAAPASAKLYKSYITDAEGDVDDAGSDIVETRIAYNRKTGAISVKLTTSEAIDETDSSSFFSVVVSNLAHGKCTKAVFVVIVPFDHLDTPLAATVKGDTHGKFRRGTGSSDDNVYNFRVKHHSLGGFTPGCSYAATGTVPDGGDGVPVDETTYNNGFS